MHFIWVSAGSAVAYLITVRVYISCSYICEIIVLCCDYDNARGGCGGPRGTVSSQPAHACATIIKSTSSSSMKQVCRQTPSTSAAELSRGASDLTTSNSAKTNFAPRRRASQNRTNIRYGKHNPSQEIIEVGKK